jgi:hypothetical protein
VAPCSRKRDRDGHVSETSCFSELPQDSYREPMKDKAKRWPKMTGPCQVLKYGALGVGMGLLTTLISCTAGVHSPAGFRLPENGDVERGQAAFVELECHRCHSVRGAELPEPPSARPIHVALGGPITGLPTDGYLVSSIIHPSHALARGLAEGEVAVDTTSRMPDYARGMTVRQLVDIVAFLQSKYERAPDSYRSP